MTLDSPYKQILERSSHYFHVAGLKPFLLSLPLSGKSAYSNQRGIEDKIWKNNSQLKQKLNDARRWGTFSVHANNLFVVQCKKASQASSTTQTAENAAAPFPDDNSNKITRLTDITDRKRQISTDDFSPLKKVALRTDSATKEETENNLNVAIFNDSNFYCNSQCDLNVTGGIKQSDADPSATQAFPQFNADLSVDIKYQKCIKIMKETVENLTNPEVKGFVLVVAELLPGSEFRPVAGGIVELLDEHERSIRGLWCRRSLPAAFSKELVRLICMVLLAHAFQWPLPGKKYRSAKKLVSTLEQTCLSFPNEAREFLGEILMMSKHYETKTNAGSHNDHPSCRCKCHKLSDNLDAREFWGISESRFIKQWKADYAFLGSIPKTVSTEYLQYSFQTRKHDTADAHECSSNILSSVNVTFENSAKALAMEECITHDTTCSSHFQTDSAIGT